MKTRMRSRPNNLALLVRRQLLTSSLAAPLALLPAAAQEKLVVTPTQTLGPFYPRNTAERPRQTDADLLNVDGTRVLSKGTPLYLTGRVLSNSGQAIANAQIEIWQCDANAVYHHPAGGAEAERDPHFQGYGQTQTDNAGAFHFRTIQPVLYPGRTPHIHVRVQARGRASLATQLYLPDAPGNTRDFLYRQLNTAERAAITLQLRPTESEHPLAQATRLSAAVDLVLA